MDQRELGRLLRGVEEHAHPEKGLSNTLVERFCHLICTNFFKGVFAADCIPQRKLAKTPRFCIVVNLGERKKKKRGKPLPVGHFVTIVASPEAVRYFDSYGFPVTQSHVLRFLRLCKRNVLCTPKQVQDFDSKICGLYASLYAGYNDPGRRRDPEFKLRFYVRRKLERNDALCVRYLRKLIWSGFEEKK